MEEIRKLKKESLKELFGGSGVLLRSDLSLNWTQFKDEYYKEESNLKKEIRLLDKLCSKIDSMDLQQDHGGLLETVSNAEKQWNLCRNQISFVIISINH